MNKRNRVVITGMGTVNSNGLNVYEYWNNILNSRFGIKNIEYKELKKSFKVGAVNFIEDETSQQYLDNSIKFLLKATREALEDSFGNDFKKYCNECACIIGNALGSIESIERYVNNQTDSIVKNKSVFLNYFHNRYSEILKKKYGFSDDKITISTTCTSSQNAIGIAFKKICFGQKKIVYVGGTEAINLFILNGLRCTGALSKSYMMPFDKNRDGMLIGEGAGAIILEEMEHALKRGAKIYAEIDDYVSFNEAYHLMVPDKTGSIIYKSLEQVLKDKNNKNFFLLVSGNGTKYNDASIINGIKKYNIEDKKIVSCIKPLIGHTLGASGIIEGIAAIKSIKEQYVLPIFGSKEFEFTINSVKEPTRSDINKVCHICTGFGGGVATIVYKKFKK